MSVLYYQFGTVSDSDELDVFVTINQVNYSCELAEEFEHELWQRGYKGVQTERMSNDPTLYYYNNRGYLAYYDPKAQEGFMPK